MDIYWYTTCKHANNLTASVTLMLFLKMPQNCINIIVEKTNIREIAF